MVSPGGRAGNAQAQNNLGSMYHDGDGVEQDVAEAVRWYREAAAQGHAGAMDELRLLGADAGHVFGDGMVDSPVASSKEPVELLVAMLADDEVSVRREAARDLGMSGELRGVGPLVATFADERADIREEAVRALGRLGDPRSYEVLVDLLGGDSIEVRREAARALGRLGDPRSYEVLVDLLGDDSVEVRREATRALGRLGDPRSYEVLVDLLGDDSVEVRREARGRWACWETRGRTTR